MVDTYANSTKANSNEKNPLRVDEVKSADNSFYRVANPAEAHLGFREMKRLEVLLHFFLISCISPRSLRKTTQLAKYPRASYVYHGIRCMD